MNINTDNNDLKLKPDLNLTLTLELTLHLDLKLNIDLKLNLDMKLNLGVKLKLNINMSSNQCEYCSQAESTRRSIVDKQSSHLFVHEMRQVSKRTLGRCLLYGTMGDPHYCTLMSITQASATVPESQRWLQLPSARTLHTDAHHATGLLGSGLLGSTTDLSSLT